MDTGQRRARAADDRPGFGFVLRWAGTQKERTRHHAAELRHDGLGDGDLGCGWLQPIFRSREQLHRRIP